MSRVVHIQGSPRTKRSHSKQVAEAFLEAYANQHPDDEIVTIDLFKADLPTFDGFKVQAKYTILHGQEHTADELDAWSDIEAVIEEFKSFDKYVFSIPMWNFGVPYRVKQYIDILTQPGYTFTVTESGDYDGLVKDRPALLVCARGGEYPENAPIDYQKPYMETFLGFIGFTDIASIVVQPTLGGNIDEVKKERIEEARALAAQF